MLFYCIWIISTLGSPEHRNIKTSQIEKVVDVIKFWQSSWIFIKSYLASQNHRVKATLMLLNLFVSLKKKFRRTLRKKCPYSELFCSAFSRVRTEYGEILRISLYAVPMRENTDQNNSEYGHFLRSETWNR